VSRNGSSFRTELAGLYKRISSNSLALVSSLVLNNTGYQTLNGNKMKHYMSEMYADFKLCAITIAAVCLPDFYAWSMSSSRRIRTKTALTSVITSTDCVCVCVCVCTYVRTYIRT
jgi:hypothetical protein